LKQIQFTGSFNSMIEPISADYAEDAEKLALSPEDF